MPETEALPQPEITKSLEHEPFSSYYDALHARLLLGGEALNPDNDKLPPVDKTKIKKFEERKDNYKIFNEASTKERQRMAGVTTDKLEQAINKWIEGTEEKKGMLEVLTQDFTQAKEFDSEKAERWRTTLNQFLKHLGIEDVSKATKIDIRKNIYDRFCHGEKKDSDLYQFVSDILVSHNNDFNSIKNNIDLYQWFAGMFGIDSQELATHLAAAETEYKQNPDAVVDKANTETDKKDEKEQPIPRRNNLNSEEDKILRFVWGEQIGAKQEKKKKEIIEVNPHDSESIKKAAEQFIKQIRNPDENKEIGKLIKARFTTSIPGDTPKYIDTRQFVSLIENRYKIPVMFAEIPRGRKHVVLPLKLPFKDLSGQWKFLYYDPYEGKQEVVIDGLDEKNSYLVNSRIRPDKYGVIETLMINGKEWKVEAFNRMFEFLAPGSGFDLTKNLPQSAFPPLQDPADKIGCADYSVFMNILLNGFREDLTPEELQGIKTFEEDFGIEIKKMTDLEEKTLPKPKAEELLRAPLTSDNSPPIRVLSSQLNRSFDHFKKEGVIDAKDLAIEMARNFYSRGMYQCVVEQEAFGPKEFERAENLQEAQKHVTTVRTELDRIEKKADAIKYAKTPDGSWLHYYSPGYEDKTYDRKYRIYLNPHANHFPKMVEELIELGKKFPLYFKIIDAVNPYDLLRLDKIVLYLTPDNIDIVADFVKKYSEENPDVFKGKMVPGGSQVTLGDGIGLARHISKGSTGGEINAKRIESRMEQKATENVAKSPNLYKTEIEWARSVEYYIFKKVMEAISVWPKQLQESTDRDAWIESLLLALYRQPKSAEKYGSHYILPVDTTILKDIFVENLRGRGNSDFAREVIAMNMKEFEKLFYAWHYISDSQLKTIGLALDLYKLISQGKKPSDFFIENNIY